MEHIGQKLPILVKKIQKGYLCNKFRSDNSKLRLFRLELFDLGPKLGDEVE